MNEKTKALGCDSNNLSKSWTGKKNIDSLVDSKHKSTVAWTYLVNIKICLPTWHMR